MALANPCRTFPRGDIGEGRCSRGTGNEHRKHGPPFAPIPSQVAQALLVRAKGRKPSGSTLGAGDLCECLHPLGGFRLQERHAEPFLDAAVHFRGRGVQVRPAELIKVVGKCRRLLAHREL